MQLALRIGVALIALALVAAALIISAGPSQSQSDARCAPLPMFEYAMERMTERLMAVGTVGGYAVRFYVDPIGRGWTVLQVNADGLACKVRALTSTSRSRRRPAIRRNRTAVGDPPRSGCPGERQKPPACSGRSPNRSCRPEPP